MTEIIDKDKAKEVLTEDQKKREAECAEEFKKLVDKYNCIVEIGMFITTRGNAPQIKFTARP
jgi:hypothetical protein